MRAALWARNSYFNPRRNRDAEKLTCPKARRTTAWTCFDFRAVLHTLRCLPLSEGAGKSLEDMLPTTHKTSRAVRRGRLGKKWDGRSSAPSTWTPSPPGQLIWSPGDPRPPVPKMHRWRWSWGRQGYSGGGRPGRREQRLFGTQPTASLRTRARQYFALE